MKKSFIKVALFGVLAITAANFVGCTDYDDDIKNLQGQVDELKSVSIADIDSQLKALKEADANLATTCSTLEAAIDEIKANLESLTKASEALKVAVDGKVDKSVYDAAIEALNGQCAELAAKLSVLSDLQAAIDALNANKADKTALDAINKAIEELKAKDAKLAEDLAALQTTINAALDGKADKTALDKLEKDLQTKLNEGLTSLRGDLEGRIGGIETSLKNLATKDELKAAKDALEARIKTLETSNESLKTATENNKNAINDLSKIVTPLKTLVDGINSRLGVAEGNISALQESIGQVDSKISTAITNLQLILEGKIDAIDAAYKAADTELARRIKVLEDAKFAKESDLNAAKADITTLQKEIYGEDGKGGLKNELSALKVQVDNLFIEGTAENGQLTAAIGAEITAALQKGGDIQKAIDAAISAATGRIDVLDSQVRDLMARIQSIVFVPQYTNADGAFVPAYFINKVGGEMTIKFRISPADRAIELAEMAQKRLGSDASILSFIVEGSALETRAAAEDLDIRGVTGTGDGIIAVTVAPNVDKFVDGKYFPTAMIVSTTKTTEAKEDSITNITTEYFKIKGQTIITSQASLESSSKNLPYTQKVATDVNVDFSEKISYAGVAGLSLQDLGFEQNLTIYSVNSILIDNQGKAVNKNEENNLKTYLDNHHITLNGNKGIQLKENDPSYMGTEITLGLAESVFGYDNSTPAVPNQIYDVTYTISDDTFTEDPVNYGTLVEKTWTVADAGNAKTYTAKIDLTKMTTLYSSKGGTPEKVLAAMKTATVEYYVDGNKVTSGDDKMVIDLNKPNEDNVTIKLPASFKWKTYNYSVVYKTTYGDIEAQANIILQYPAEETFLVPIDARWITNNVTYFVQYEKPKASDTNFEIINNLNGTDAQAYKVVPGADYTFALNNADKFTGIEVASDGKITISQEIKYTTDEGDVLAGQDAIDKVRITTTVTVAGNKVATEDYGIQVSYPIPANITVANLPYSAKDILAGTPLDIASKITLADRWSTSLIAKAKIQTYAKDVWGMKGESDHVIYTLEVGAESAGLRVEDFTLDATKGTLLLNETNLAQKAVVTIKVKTTNNYGESNGTFTVTLEPTK
ncbi:MULTISPECIES: hypothetical protein [unclassified Bacteroides]|jgi:chaperonin cofactor prefoldin|uniref:hypothetical protein n=1 Tax=unclassified Bacteroides TaxID=2646097 RepID=UPI000E8FB1BB|nr:MULTISPECIES: hypothetical protein [unclassified Bacteroides]RGN50346.1 hypothetical protein DXB63_04215 [Bacteroides sp. OM05-12]RHR76931.1 hypothetical protein DWW69_07065 [Bacteroides sp. AF16-49]